MLWMIAVILIILWVLGLATGFMMVGYFIHILLVIAIIVLIIWLIQRRRP